jgi:hypothetical protein
MYITISSSSGVSLTLWELCPVAAGEEVETIIDGVKQSLPRLLYDYNTFPLEIGQSETTVAVITCRLLQSTDLQGHFLMSFLASKTATLTLRFYDNEAEELFAPLYYDTRVGYNSIGVPHAYMSRLAGLHSFMVTAQIASGILTVDTRRVLFTIDGGYLAVRELDIGMDITDIAIRQLASNNGPDQIWCVGLDAGDALIRYRDYNEKNASVGWTAVGSLGPARSAAVEFNGKWVLRQGTDQFTLHTDEEPWYFWVDNDLFLYACHGLPFEDRSNVVELASMVVSDIKAVRGYSSIDYIEQDQGLIVAYIKDDGNAYYRAYSYNTTRREVIWEEEQNLNVPGYLYSFINVHRLNDYRVAFELSGNDRNLWIISDRTYVGQSAYPEKYDSLSLPEEEDAHIQYIGYLPADYVPHVPEVIEQGTDYYTVTKTITVSEEHYFKYNYSSKIRGNDLGEKSEVEQRYGKPSIDAIGAYFVIDGNKVYVKKFAVNKHVHEEEGRWVFWFILDREVWASDGYFFTFDRISFNNSLSKNDLEDVEWEHSNGTTYIKVTMRKAPASLVTYIYLNASNNTLMRMLDSGYIVSYSNRIDILFDYTNYISHDQYPDVYSELSIAQLVCDYGTIKFPIAKNDDAYINLNVSNLVCAYGTVRFPRIDANEEYNRLSVKSIAIGYYKSGDEPI